MKSTDQNQGAVCLVGTRWGLFLGQELRSFYKGPLIVCGQDSKRLLKVARILKADQSLLGWERILHHPEITSVIIAVPPGLHCQVAVPVLLSEKHVLVEKPIATTLEESNKMIDAAKSAGVVLATGENIPFRPVVQQVKRRIAEIGEPRLFVASRMHVDVTNSTDVLLDVGVHYIRAVRELFGEPDTVFASRAAGMNNQRDQSQDNVTLVLGSPAGWRAILTFSKQSSVGSAPEFIITGTHGAMKVWPDSRSLDIYPLKPNWLTRAIAGVRPNALLELLQSPETQRERVRLPRKDCEGYRAELKMFMHAAQLKLPEIGSALGAQRDLAIIMAAYSSLASGSVQHCSYYLRRLGEVTQICFPKMTQAVCS